MPRKAPAIEPKESRDAIFAEQSPFFVCSIEVLRKLRCESRETYVNAKGKRVAGKTIEGDPLTLMMVYGALCNHANSQKGHRNEAWPRYERIAEMIGVSKKTVERFIPILIERGLIVHSGYRRTRSGKGHVNVFRIVHVEGLSKEDETSIANYQALQRHPTMSAQPPVIHNGQTSQACPLNDIKPENEPLDRHPRDVATLYGHPKHVAGTVLNLNTTGHGLNGTQPIRLLENWREQANEFGVPIFTNDEDLAAAQRLADAKIQEDLARKAIREAYISFEAYRQKGDEPPTRLEPIVHHLLSNSQTDV